jgi:hypothetical protein
MKKASLVLGISAALALAALTAPLPAHACRHGLNLSGDHVRWADHHDLAAARYAITTEDGKVTLVLTDDDVAIQLSDRTLHRVRRELKDKEEDEENFLASIIKTVVIGTVGEMIDHSFACPVRKLRDVSYQDGRLVLTDKNGSHVFEDADIDDTDVMASFSERDARNFVREFHRLKVES